ncbi:MAG TPA: shikimate dehydrogenase [Clostridia bacterium]|nr:shikimate dehydrogenase [Clostridia bacterium]
MKIDIDNRTRLYAVIGDPISHSLSPVFQNHFIKLRNINAVYIPLRITADNLKNSLELLKNNFAGFNVTIPHKEKIMQYLDKIDPLAVEYGAVNTVKIIGGKLVGYNTDGTGFIKSIENADINLGGKKVLLLGAGGVAKVIASEIIKLGGNLTIANRNIERGIQLKNQLERSYGNSVNVISPRELNTSFDVIINSTSVGMHPDINKSPVDSDILRDAELVYDVIYNPFETRLLKLGNELGAKIINGLPMLIYQGLRSFEIWTGEQATHEEENKIYKTLETEKVSGGHTGPPLFKRVTTPIMGVGTSGGYIGPPLPLMVPNKDVEELGNLEHIRNIIDDCDKKLVAIFEQRLKAVLDVLEYKREHKLPIFQPERERKIFKRVNSYLEHDEFSGELELLYHQILKISRKLQSKHLFPFNIVLIGFMGSGKTSVGTELSTLLEMDYIDTDDIIVRNSGMSINEIFNIYGEAEFRRLETQAIKGLQDTKNTIISCGGGVVLNPENINLLKNNGRIAWLKVSPDEAFDRLLGDNNRPLLKDNFTVGKLSQILESRLPLYEDASDMIIDTDKKNVQEIAREIIKKLLGC